MSFDQKNQFMNQSNSSAPSFQQFMKACYQSPSFFESMKHVYMSNVEQGAGNNSSLNMSNSFSQNNDSRVLPQSKRRQVQQEIRVEERDQEVALPAKSRDMKKKPANPLLKFIPAESNKPDPEPVPKIQSKVPTYDEIPIKSNYIGQNFDLSTMKQNKSINIDNPNKSINFDDMPIRGARQYQLDSYYPEEKEDKRMKNSSYVQMEDRPLTGCNKDFKQMLKEQFPNAIVQQEQAQEVREQERKTEPRNFLKRGSRSHLSSALNRSKQPKNKDNSMTKSQLDDQRSITPRKNQPEGRSTSQNRVLAKKNTINSQKVVPNKSTMNSRTDESFDEGAGRAKPPLYKPAAKVEPKSVKAADRSQAKPSPANIQKKKTKNVFRDDSDESSESSQEENAPYFKSTKKIQPSQTLPAKPSKNDTLDLIEPVEGVYMTQEQLDAIISRYGRVKQVVRQAPQSEKLAALRKKYQQMTTILQEESEQNKLALERQRQEFERYKAEQMNKIKNDRRVMERQVKSGFSSNNQKDKEQLEQLRHELEREREDYKRKEKNSRIMLDKHKKENEQLKNKIQRFEAELSNKPAYTPKEDDKVSVARSNKVKKAVEEEAKVEEINYRDIKKGSKAEDTKSTKPKYQYVEDEPNVKGNMGKTEPSFKPQNKWKGQWDSQSDASQQQQIIEDSDEPEDTCTHSSSHLTKLSDLLKPNLSIKQITNQTIQQLFRHQNNPDYLNYLSSLSNFNRKVVNTNRNNKSDYTAKLYSDRSKELIYDNGTRKVTQENGYSIVYFKNGDIKQTLPDKTVLYYFKEKEVDQITLPNGMNIYRFQNNQVEFHFDNGYIEIRHADGTIKVLGGQHTRR